MTLAVVVRCDHCYVYAANTGAVSSAEARDNAKVEGFVRRPVLTEKHWALRDLCEACAEREGPTVERPRDVEVGETST